MTVNIRPPTDEREANDNGGASDAELLIAAEALLAAAEELRRLLRGRAEANGALPTWSGLNEYLVEVLLTGKVTDVT